MSDLWLAVIGKCRKMSKRRNPGEEEVCAAPYGRKCRQAGDFFSHRTLGNFEFPPTVVIADDGVAFISELVKIPVIYPDVLREFVLPNEACADDKSGDAALHSILRRVFGQIRSVGGAATDHAAAIHVRGGVAGIHAAHVRAQWNRISMRIHLLIVEVIVSLRIKPQPGII